MFRVISFFLLAMTTIFSEGAKRYKIGVCITAMESYDTCAQSLIESGRRYFCVNHDVTYFVFTCSDKIFDAPDVVKICRSPMGWPYDILKRVHLYEDRRHLLEGMDYIFAMAASMEFVAPVGNEVLSDLTAVQHPAFMRRRGAYENKKNSTAFVNPHEGEHYFTSRFCGGSKDEFLKLISTVKKQIDADLVHGYIARMYDESYLNRYFIDHPPTKILSPSYSYPIDWKLDVPPKIVTVSKGKK